MNPEDNTHTHFDIEVPVLVVGAGPAGLTATLLLERLGVKALTVTRYGWTANTPRAHYQNQRAIEIFRELGLDGEVAATGLPHHLMRYIVWAESLSGKEFARLAMYPVSRSDEYIQASPCRSSNIAQHLLEPILARAAMERGTGLLWNHEFIDLTQDADGVTARVLNRLTGVACSIRAKYVIGADGARSKVADSVGITHTGVVGWASAVNVWFRADLAKYCAHRPGVLYAISQPGGEYWIGSGMFVNVQPWNEWVFSFMYDPKSGEAPTDNESILKRVRDAVGDDSLALEILAVSPWQMNAQVADTMSVGRVFIAGDAAHRHPPLNALGSNTSIQDSYNLCWKLKLVLDGTAESELLQTYDQERRPVAQQVIDRSMQSVEDHGAMAAALGFTANQTEAEGWRAYNQISDATPTGHARRVAFAEALDLQHYEFSAHGVELGFRYGEGAVAGEPDSIASRDSWRDRQLTYVMTTAPGAHVPHAWLEFEKKPLATIDLAGRSRFALLIGHAGAAWEQAATQARAELGIDLITCAIGVGLPYLDVMGAWMKLREVGDDGCVLVRPDQVVAWRAMTLPKDPGGTLRNVLSKILSHGPQTPAGELPNQEQKERST